MSSSEESSELAISYPSALYEWRNTVDIGQKRYRCGYCDSEVGPLKGYFASQRKNPSPQPYIYICPHCNQPTYFDPEGNQVPGRSFGSDVPHITNERIETLYRQARDCMIVNAYTGAVLTGRKLILDVAEDLRKQRLESLQRENKDTQSAKKKLEQFAPAVRWLITNQYVPQQSRDAFEQLPKIGGEETHRQQLADRDTAEWFLSMVEQLLRLAYQYPSETRPAKIPDQVAAGPDTSDTET